MAVRTFGTSALLTLAGDSSDLGTAGHSWVLLVRPTSLSNFKDYLAARASTVTVSGLFGPSPGSSLDCGADAGDSTAALSITTNAWQIIGSSKASGATTARLHRSVLGSGSWTHTTGTGSYTTVTTALTSILIGAADGASTAVAGNYAVAALFLRSLSDAEFESFVDQTSDIYNASGGHPVALWEFNQASTGTSVTDLVGNADQTALSGTSVDTVNVPTWTFDGLGSGTDATVTAVPADGLGAAPAPTVQAGSTVTAVPADGLGAFPAPGVSAGTNQTVTAPAADGTGAAPAPVLSAGSTITAPAADGTGAFPPTNQIISAEVVTGAAPGTGAFPPPTVSAASSGTVTAVPADGVGAFPAPTVQAGSTVTSAAADGTGAFPVPTVSGSAAGTVNALPCSGVGAFPAPAVSGTQSATVTAVPCSGVGSFPAPTPNASNTATAVPADGTGAFPAPAVTATSGVTITAPPAAGIGQFLVPGITATGSATVISPAARSIGGFPVPVVFGGSLGVIDGGSALGVLIDEDDVLVGVIE